MLLVFSSLGNYWSFRSSAVNRGRYIDACRYIHISVSLLLPHAHTASLTLGFCHYFYFSLSEDIFHSVPDSLSYSMGSAFQRVQCPPLGFSVPRCQRAEFPVEWFVLQGLGGVIFCNSIILENLKKTMFLVLLGSTVLGPHLSPQIIFDGSALLPSGFKRGFGDY